MTDLQSELMDRNGLHTGWVDVGQANEGMDRAKPTQLTLQVAGYACG